MSHAMMISLGLLVVCFLIRMPIAIGMIISSTLYLAVKGMDPSVVVEIFTSKMYNNFILLAVPLFIFAANIMNSSKVTDKIFDFSKVLVGRWKGGLGHVNVIASLIFSGMTGSAVADASGLGIMEIEAMRKEGYDDGFSAAITAGSAVIGPIFPPSIPLVIYGSSLARPLEICSWQAWCLELYWPWLCAFTSAILRIRGIIPAEENMPVWNLSG